MNKENKENPNREVKIDKVTINIGVGQPGEELENAKKLLERITGRTPIETLAKERNPTFKIRKGLPIGAKVTLRGKEAEELLERAFKAKKHKISKKSIDKNGNFSIGFKQYIDLPGVKYDPRIGMLGFDVCVTLKRNGYRVKNRMLLRTKVGKRHRITAQDTIQFLKQKFNVEVE